MEEYARQQSPDEIIQLRQQKEIGELIRQIEAKKKRIDALNQQINNQETKQRRFQNQYDLYIADLDRSYQRLQKERDSLLQKISELRHNPPPLVGEQDEETTENGPEEADDEFGTEDIPDREPDTPSTPPAPKDSVEGKERLKIHVTVHLVSQSPKKGIDRGEQKA